MSTITISMPQADLEYLQRLAAKEGVSLDDYLAKQSRWLRQLVERPLHPDVLALSGIIKDDVDDEKKLYHEHMLEKHS
jgi:hypothetical protein